MRPDLAALGTAIVVGTLSSTPTAAAAVEFTRHVSVRALPNAPNGYAPANVTCPETRPSVRSAATLSPSEMLWLKERRKKTTEAMVGFFSRIKIPDFNAQSYIQDHTGDLSALPNIGIAAFDNRTPNSTSPGHLGGLLQTATYLSSLSGGGWLTGSIYIYDSVEQKMQAGFDVSLTDYWGRALSYQLIDAPRGGIDYTWSSIALDPEFQAGNMPMPIVVADGRNPGELLVGGNATVFEFNPWEFGTHDPTIFGFVPLEYIGSKFDGGSLPPSESCVRGFDNAGYIMGTSSSLFNQFLLNLDSVDMPAKVKKAIQSLLERISNNDNDIASYSPSPFYHYANDTSPFAQIESLNMVDGGEDLQNIPLHPLIQPNRQVDVIFAVDSSADTIYNWPNGTALVATYERSQNPAIANGTVFPHIPDVNTFVNLGLNKKPTFFGCDSGNVTGTTPLVVYIPNSPYSTFSNVSTFQMSYPPNQRNDILQNGYLVATMGNGTVDPNWPTCVGCAMLSRSLERTNTPVPPACQKCFDTYCWDGTLNSTAPPSYEPSPIFARGNAVASRASRVAPRSLISLVAGCMTKLMLLA
ncbi:hypothetical protein ACJ72_07592 [Emergomyces africanus]|uniref:Lysophospholipase n=1 Tax=Emergomyces africanus TaxID=1955775 RepID=A0A1B7NMR1_9EURO|nr:hypothetical protein ACJ72_07592 [Emergomyces africanus]